MKHIIESRFVAKTLVSLLLFIGTGATCLADGAYELTVNGETYDIGLNNERSIKLSTGDTITISLSLKDVITYESDLLSFSHKGKYKPAKSELVADVFQTALVTPTASVIVVQESIGGEALPTTDTLMDMVTRLDRKGGYAYQEQSAVRMVGDLTLHGKMAVLTDEGRTKTYHLYRLEKEGNGVSVMTLHQILPGVDPLEGEEMIQLFWETFELKI